MRKTYMARLLGASLGFAHCARIPIDTRVRAYFGARSGGKGHLNYQQFHELAQMQARDKGRIRMWCDEAAVFSEEQWKALKGNA